MNSWKNKELKIYRIAKCDTKEGINLKSHIVVFSGKFLRLRIEILKSGRKTQGDQALLLFDV